MDTVAQIKNNLISRIQNSKDLKFLTAIQTIFDSTEQTLYPISQEQENSIEISRKQIKNKEFSSNESVISEMKKWLTKK